VAAIKMWLLDLELIRAVCPGIRVAGGSKEFCKFQDKEEAESVKSHKAFSVTLLLFTAGRVAKKNKRHTANTELETRGYLRIPTPRE